MIHKILYGHKKETAIIGYDGICNVWGCAVCEAEQSIK